MNQMLELTDKYIKAAIIATANEVKQNMFSVNENLSREVGDLSREIKTTNWEAHGSYRTEIRVMIKIVTGKT